MVLDNPDNERSWLRVRKAHLSTRVPALKRQVRGIIVLCIRVHNRSLKGKVKKSFNKTTGDDIRMDIWFSTTDFRTSCGDSKTKLQIRTSILHAEEENPQIQRILLYYLLETNNNDSNQLTAGREFETGPWVTRKVS